jgi:iron-sulfur cluster assembly protein
MSSTPAVIRLTDAAVDRILILLAKVEGREVGLRVSVEKGGCAGMSYKMELAKPEPGDEIVEQGGARVIVGAEAVLYLLGARMDVKTDRFSSSFVFDNPNETASCGCGESVAFAPAAARME